jgi:proteasome activator subunit 4
MAVDGPIRDDVLQLQKSGDNGLPTQQLGYLAGSKALDSLDRMITSTESFFHPSNSGPWTMNVSSPVLVACLETDARNITVNIFLAPFGIRV